MSSDPLLEAGPEWAYFAARTEKVREKIKFDGLILNVRRESDPSSPEIDTIQLIEDSKRDTRATVPIAHYSLEKLKQEFIGEDSDRLKLSFEAFEGAGSVEIPDERSFRRLLLAVGHIGLPMPSSYQGPVLHYPPVLRFLARPKDLLHTDVTPIRKTNDEESTVDPQNSPEEEEDDEMSEQPEDSPPQSSEDSIVENTRAESSYLVQTDDPDEELSLEDRVKQVLDFSLSNDRDEIHKRKWHDLYANIAGIKLNKFDSSKKRHQYRPPYSSIRLPPYQTYPTGWILGNRRRILHFLADSPGLGKTFAAIEAMVRVAMILSLSIAITDERKNLETSENDPVHIHSEKRDHYGKRRNTVCQARTKENYGIVCPCTPGSPTRELAKARHFSPGYMLVLVPPKLTPQWIREINRFIHPEARLPHSGEHFEIIDVREKGGTKIGKYLKECIYADREDGGLGRIIVASPTTMVMPSKKEIQNRDKPDPTDQPCMIVWDEIQDTKSPENQSAQLVKLLIEKADKPVHVVALSGTPMPIGPKDFDLVESIALANKLDAWWPQRTRKNAKSRNRLKQARESLEDLTKEVLGSIPISNCQAGVPLSDHERNQATDLLRRFDDAGREYSKALPLLQRKSGDNYFGFPVPLVQPESEKAEIQPFDSPLNDTQKSIAAGFKSMLNGRLAVKSKRWSKRPEKREGEEFTFKGQLFQLEPDNKISSANPTFDASRIDLSLAAFAPGLATEILGRTADSSEFRVEQANNFFRNTTVATQREAIMKSKYWDRALDAFNKDNPATGQAVTYDKFTDICGIISDMLEDNDRHQNRSADLEPLRKKAVICVPYPWHGYILIAALFQRFPQHNFTYIGSKDTVKDQNELLEPFRRETGEYHAAEDDPDDPIALISTYSVIAEGFNLTRCNYAIATSPLSSVAYEIQLFSRINRRGQHCKTHTYVLLDHGDPTDVVTFHRMRRRTGLTVPEEEVGSGLRFLLEEDQLSEHGTSVDSGAQTGGSDEDDDSTDA